MKLGGSDQFPCMALTNCMIFSEPVDLSVPSFSSAKQEKSPTPQFMQHHFDNNELTAKKSNFCHLPEIHKSTPSLGKGLDRHSNLKEIFPN